MTWAEAFAKMDPAVQAIAIAGTLLAVTVVLCTGTYHLAVMANGWPDPSLYRSSDDDDDDDDEDDDSPEAKSLPLTPPPPRFG